MDALELLKLEGNPAIEAFTPGDTVKVNIRIREGDRERVQPFQGVVIRCRHGNTPGADFTVRRMSGAIGIERIFQLHSPLVESVEIVRHGSVRRAKLYYLRALRGRAARIKERSQYGTTATAAAPIPEEPVQPPEPAEQPAE
ncbi:MAG: 50S ribosomal protein L19 [Dehalococcoidia bacterium]|nr:50S ribosomal protein L19 [Dehalococcoidia bacterium]MSQ16691.1 50S ribosomal protein L19 [Dehalococcoidia bacterium]